MEQERELELELELEQELEQEQEQEREREQEQEREQERELEQEQEQEQEQELEQEQEQELVTDLLAPDELDRLEKLHEAATPGPWSDKYGYNNGGCPTHYFQIPGSNIGAEVEMLAEDSTLIVELRNALPSLLAAARRAHELEGRLYSERAEMEDMRARAETAERERDELRAEVAKENR